LATNYKFNAASAANRFNFLKEKKMKRNFAFLQQAKKVDFPSERKTHPSKF
jgi:hypothetical protein